MGIDAYAQPVVSQGEFWKKEEIMPVMPEAPRVYRMLVRDLVVLCFIGVHPHERDARQRVRVNVEMAVLETAGPLCDDIANVLSYEDVISGIKDLLARGHINLVETAAEKIAALCLSDSRVQSVRVRVEKPDIYQEVDAVGIEIERRRG